jgi:hypothetical protein
MIGKLGATARSQGDVSQSRTVWHVQIEQHDVERIAPGNIQSGKEFLAPRDFCERDPCFAQASPARSGRSWRHSQLATL